MDAKDIRKKIIRGEIDVNSVENFFLKLIKGLMSDLVDSIKVRGKSVPHLIVNTGDDTMYLEQKGQDISIEPTEVSNEKYIYNYIPRGVMTPGGMDILTDQLTSPYTRGQFQFEYGGNLCTFTAEFRRMPLKMQVGVKYYLDSFTDTLEVMQYIVTHVNFIRNYQIVYMGQSIPCSYRFPDNLEEQFNAEFDGLSKDSKYKTVEIQLEIESNIPVFYNRTAIESDLTISGEYIYVVDYMDDGTEEEKTFDDEDEAEEFAQESGGIMRRERRMLWNKTPVFNKSGQLTAITDHRDEYLEGINTGTKKLRRLS